MRRERRETEEREEREQRTERRERRERDGDRERRVRGRDEMRKGEEKEAKEPTLLSPQRRRPSVLRSERFFGVGLLKTEIGDIYIYIYIYKRE